jgi:diacylglycerol kinase family enzyme
MADINDRLERMQRRDELARRMLRQRAVPESVAEVGEDFVELVEAAAQVVRRHPGMSIMIAPGDGRQSSAVVRISERDGDVDVAMVRGAP